MAEATHKTFAYLHGLPVPLDEVWSWVGDTPVDVTVIRDEKDCAAQAAKREAQLELEKRLEEVGALFGVDDRHAHRGRGGPPATTRPKSGCGGGLAPGTRRSSSSRARSGCGWRARRDGDRHAP